MFNMKTNFFIIFMGQFSTGIKRERSNQVEFFSVSFLSLAPLRKLARVYNYSYLSSYLFSYCASMLQSLKFKHAASTSNQTRFSVYVEGFGKIPS